MLTRRQSLLGSGALSATSALWGALLGLVAVPVMIHSLGFTAYGMYGLAFTIVGFGSYLDFGLGWTTARFVAEADVRRDAALLSATLRAAILYQLTVGLLFVAVVVPSADGIARFLLPSQEQHAATMTAVIRVAACSFLLSSVAGVLISALRGTRHFAMATAASVTGLTLSVGGATTVAGLGYGVVSAAFAQSVGAGAALAVAFWACRESVSRSDSRISVRSQLRAMLSFSIWNYLNRLGQLVSSELDKVVVGRFAGAAYLPFYLVPYGLTQRLNAVTGPALTAIYPTATVGQYDRTKFLAQYFSAARAVHVLTASGALAMFFWGPRFLEAWIGPEMAAHGAFFLRAFTVGFWVLSVGSFDGGCIEGWNHPRATAAIVFISLAAAIPIAITLFPIIGAAHAVAVAVAAWQISTGIGQMLYWQHLSCYPISKLRSFGVPIVEMAFIALGISVVMGPLVSSHIIIMAVLPAMALGLGAYGVMRAFPAAERRALMRRITSRAELENAATTTFSA